MALAPVARAVVARADAMRARLAWTADLAARRFLTARWWRIRATRFWARALSVTCPLDLALVVEGPLALLLDASANEALNKTKIETKKTKSRSRNVIGITCHPNTRENSLSPWTSVPYEP